MKHHVRVLIIISFVSLFFYSTSFVYALGESIKITEIMYDAPGTDTDHEWVEIQNVSESDINLTGWKIYDGSNHTLNAPPTNGGQGSIIIPSGAFAVITANAVTFLQDYPSVSGAVIDSVLSLSNSGDTIKIIDQSGGVMDEVAYTNQIGASGDGNTLSWYQNGWVSARASPLLYTTSISQSTTVSTSTASVETTTFTDSQKEPVWQLEIIPSTQSVFSQVPFTLSAHVLNPDKKIRTIGKFVYTLGDGRKITTSNAAPVEITYSDPGTYIVHLDFYDSETDINPTLSDRLLLSVEDTPILLSVDVHDSRKIKLSNLHPLDIDLSKWVLTDGVHHFTFPQNTFLPGKKEVVLNPTLHTLATKHLVLETPVGAMIATYPSAVKMVSLSHTGSIGNSTPTLTPMQDILTAEKFTAQTKRNSVFSEANALEANVSKGGLPSWTLFFIIFVLVSTGILFVFFQKQGHRNIDV